MVDNRPSTRPEIWVTPSHTNWTRRDSTTVYQLQVFNDEQKTQPRNLTGEQIFIIISVDFPYDELDVIEVTDKITDALNGILQTTFTKNQVNTVGEWKVEFYVLDIDGVTRYYSHHIDFNVVI